MGFPEDPLPLIVELFLLGEWVPVTEFVTVTDDFYVDEYVDEYLGRNIHHLNRFPDQQLGLSHGRTDEFSQVSPASVEFQLWNHDGWFTPQDPRSPYWPDVRKGCPVRIRLDDPVATLFNGQVSEIHPTWPLGDLSQPGIDELDLASEDVRDVGEAFVSITANGITRKLGQGAKPLRSPLARVTVNPTNLPHMFDVWPMEDGQDADGASSGLPAERYTTPGDLPLMSTIGWSVASDDSLMGSDPLPNVSGGADAAWNVKVSPFTTVAADGEWVVEWFMRIPQGPSEDNSSIFVDIHTTGSHRKWTIRLGFDGTDPFLRVRSYSDSGILIDTLDLDPDDLFMDDWVVCRLKAKDSGANIVWSFSWFPVTTGSTPGHGLGTTEPGSCGAPTFLRCEIANAPQGGVSWGHVILRDQGINDNWMVGPDVGHHGERSATRFNRLCAEEGIPKEWVGGPSGSGLSTTGTSRRMGAQKARPLLELLQECADTDAGIFCEQRVLYALKFRGRGSLYNQTVKLSLDAAQSDIANPFEPVDDDQTIRNDVTAQRIDGGQWRLKDEDSIEEFGVYDETIQVSTDEDFKTRHYAGWHLHFGTWKGLRYPQVTIDLALRPELIEDWLTIRVGDRIQIANLPPQHPLGTVDLMVQGWTENIGPRSWTVTINCSPAGPYTVGVWNQSRWSPRESFLTAGIDDTDTSFQVTTPGVDWTTDDAQFPFDIQVGPERMTVTDIAGSSPQTFTVTRNVNQLGRAHDSGTEVGLAEPAILAI